MANAGMNNAELFDDNLIVKSCLHFLLCVYKINQISAWFGMLMSKYMEKFVSLKKLFLATVWMLAASVLCINANTC